MVSQIHGVYESYTKISMTKCGCIITFHMQSQKCQYSNTLAPWPVLISRASRSAVASFSQLDADRKVTTKAHLSKLTRAAREIRRQRTMYRSLYCAYPVCSQVVSAVWPRLLAEERARCWVPRQLSETRSATAVKGSQMSCWLCSLLSVAWHLSHRRFAPSRTRPSPKAAVAYVCGEEANVESLAHQACEQLSVNANSCNWVRDNEL